MGALSGIIGGMKVKVRCTFEVVVDFPDEDIDHVYFQIEENGCPATGVVGAAVQRAIEECDAGSGACWACGFGGKCEVVEIEGR